MDDVLDVIVKLLTLLALILALLKAIGYSVRLERQTGRPKKKAKR